MNSNSAFFLENLEWFDESGQELVHRLPEEGSGEIKYGAQLTIRESQAGVFYYKGKAVGAFGPGRHTLKTGNIPLLTKIASIPWGMKSPLRAEMYFVNLKIFTNMKWGTRDPVAFKDSELGLIRLRAFGVFNLQVGQPVLFINRLVGTQGMYKTDDIEEYLNRVIVSRYNDYMGETIDSILNLPSQYDELSEGLAKRLHEDFSHFGINLTHLYINAITPPPEVQQAIDDRSRMGVFDDMNKLMQMKAAMAMEKASDAEGGAGSGMGAGMGLMMPAMFAQYFSGSMPQAQQKAQQPDISCPDCKQAIAVDAKFCPQCGHQQLVYNQCTKCSKNLTPNAKFCSRCGTSAEEMAATKSCPTCGNENLGDASFCNECGEKL
ncbi:Putative virion core protein (lumpy skin disease virus) [Olavius algarvensis Delta 1 endosymbiont]|nr:Putative virion core protein (lumpy skin disease virus) [Olavius algarvensis Delta 1 endosymbiont]